MIELYHFAYRLTGAAARVGRTSALTLVLVAALTGCRHKTAAFVIPKGAHAPIELEVPSSPDPPPTIATLPLPASPPRKRTAPAPKEEPPAQVAEAAPAALAIGTLSTGGDPTPQSRNQAQQMIASIMKRIAALPARTADAEKKQIRQIRHFLDQARQALNSGDAEGANNLATKARLLLDDLEKK